MKSLNIHASEIAKLLGGEIYGNDVLIKNASTLENAGENSIGFLIDVGKYRKQLKNSAISALICQEKIPNEEYSGCQILVKNVRQAWRILTEYIEAQNLPSKREIAASAVISKTATIADDVCISANAVIDDEVQIASGVEIGPCVYIGKAVKIGANTRIEAGVKILSKTTIGENCRILPNAVVGSRGFGNSFEDGRWIALPQIGGVEIEDDVEIGACTTIDCGALGNTIIRKGVKIDNLVQIAHNVEIGEHTAIAGCCVFAGSVKIGKYCVIGGASVFNGHIEIADGVMVTGHSSVSKSITEEKSVFSSSFPGTNARDWKRFIGTLKILVRNYHKEK